MKKKVFLQFYKEIQITSAPNMPLWEAMDDLYLATWRTLSVNLGSPGHSSPTKKLRNGNANRPMPCRSSPELNRILGTKCEKHRILTLVSSAYVQ